MDAENRYDPKKFARSAEPAEGGDENALLPGLTTDYKASATAGTKALTRLVVIFGKDGFRPGNTAYVAFQYVHLGCGDFSFTPDGQVFSFVVSDLQPKRLTVHGFNLLRVFDYISLHRMPWIRQVNRAFSPDAGDPVITRIEITDWEPKPEAKSTRIGELDEVN